MTTKLRLTTTFSARGLRYLANPRSATRVPRSPTVSVALLPQVSQGRSLAATLPTNSHCPRSHVSTAEARTEADDRFFIVGVGASAGGVEALEQLFASMPDQLEAALVVITHLSAHRESLLAEIIGRRTRMPVVNATHGGRVQAGHIYVLPAEHVLTLQGSELILQHLESGQRERNPIDVFFSSIAKQWHERSVGIVLSGAGTDGTLGIKAIKEEGGLTIAQGHGASGPAYDSMPSSAVASGLVDLVLPAEEIGTKLQQYVRSLHALDAIADDADERRRRRAPRRGAAGNPRRSAQAHRPRFPQLQGKDLPAPCAPTHAGAPGRLAPGLPGAVAPGRR